jgi:hypothetical protein
VNIARIVAALPLLASATVASADPQLIEQAGPFRHVGSNTSFPEQVSIFSRSRIVRYEDPMGEDISVGYGAGLASGQRVVITEYVYPAPQPAVGQTRQGLCREEFDLSAAEIQKHPNAQKLGEPAAPGMSGSVPTNGYRATFTFTQPVDGTPQTIQSQILLYCYVGGNWFVKYRASSLPGADLSSAVNGFVTIGPWPGKP